MLCAALASEADGRSPNTEMGIQVYAFVIEKD